MVHDFREYSSGNSSPARFILGYDRLSDKKDSSIFLLYGEFHDSNVSTRRGGREGGLKLAGEAKRKRKRREREQGGAG